MRDHLPPGVNHSHRTRTDFVFHDIKCNSDSYKRRFFPDSIVSWNRLGSNLRNSENLKSFKTNLLAFYRPVPKIIYGIHDPQGLRWLFQLRLGLSPLLSHKKTHNFLDTPSDLCVGCNCPENLEHFLLYCVRFSVPRQSLMDSVRVLCRNFDNLNQTNKSKLLLYGDTSLNKDTNRLILTETLRYLKNSGRFS